MKKLENKMLTVTKEFSFDAAHMLYGHDGLCKNVHGHTYKLFVTLKDDQSGENDMVMDFSEIKRKVNAYLVDWVDHTFMYDMSNPQETAIADLLREFDMRLYEFRGRTTCENMARHIFYLLSQEIENLEAIKLYETPTSFAEVTA
jgi:6-pyruvoyltetrahydropterin/6-carboxytetrahydropterin synthase